jgi:sRNA-binding carbon storage regulator CsrA
MLDSRCSMLDTQGGNGMRNGRLVLSRKQSEMVFLDMGSTLEARLAERVEQLQTMGDYNGRALISRGAVLQVLVEELAELKRVEVQISSIDRGKVRLSFKAPATVTIMRNELTQVRATHRVPRLESA